ncbi:MAG: DUF3500 domain-containing protein [Cytophagales bacterium]|nr:DUF3500 domain-containing protein [Cytophagales bacterium]
MEKMKYFVPLMVVVFLSFEAICKTEPSVLATRFLNSLDAAQKEKVLMSLEDESRSKWHFLPPASWPRPGLPLKVLNDRQKGFIHELLQVYLSDKGYQKTLDIIALEEVLAVLENDPVKRDSEMYFVAFYGDPANDETWGWRFEGHHVSLNFTVVGKQVAYVPRFFGANPGTVREGPKKGTRVLKNEEDLGLKLVNMLNEAQKKKAIFRLSAFQEIVTSNASEVEPLDEVGIPVKDMNKAQQEVLFELLKEYLSAMPHEVAEKRMSNLRTEETDAIRFGWAGATEIGKPHYYRIQGKTFLVEFDNTQNNANHIHTVWRDFDGDFGRDLIREHYQRSGHH